MPAINFTMFADKVRNFEKRQTIRKLRKRPFKVGDKLYLYTGLRTKNCKPLSPGVVTVKEVHDIKIKFSGIPPVVLCSIVIDYHQINYIAAFELSKNDGFENFGDFLDFFFDPDDPDDFHGQLIKW